MRARLPLALAILVATMAPIPAFGSGAGEASGTTTGGGGQVVVAVPGSTGPGYPGSGYRGGGNGSAHIQCRYFNATSTVGSPLPGIGTPVGDTSQVGVGTYVWLICRDTTSGTITFESLSRWDPANPPALTPSAAVLAQMAANGMRLPVPGVRTWPASGSRGLVNLPVWLHVDNWATLSASASAGGLAATVEAVPIRAEWAMDDGAVTCTDAGSAYDVALRPDPASSSCSYTYRRSSGTRADLTFHDSATVVWHLRWFATNGQGGDLGEVSSPAARFDLQIEESQALVAPPAGQS